MTKFTSRVQVFHNGELVGRIHGEQAATLLSSGAVGFGDGDRFSKRVWRVTLLKPSEFWAKRTGPARRSSPRHYATASPVFKQVLGYVGDKRLITYTFRPFSKDDVHRIRAERAELMGVERAAVVKLAKVNGACQTCKGSKVVQPDRNVPAMACWDCC